MESTQEFKARVARHMAAMDKKHDEEPCFLDTCPADKRGELTRVINDLSYIWGCTTGEIKKRLRRNDEYLRKIELDIMSR